MRAVLHRRDGLLAHRPQRVGLGAAAALGERLGHVREHDRQPQPDRDRERVPGRIVRRRAALPPNTWISQVTVVITAPISTTNITGLRIWTRGSSFMKLSISARLTMSRRNSEIAWRSWASRGASARGVRCSRTSAGLRQRRLRARFSSSTLTPGSPENPSPRPLRVGGDQAVDRRQRQVAHGRDPVGLDVGVGDRDVGVDAGGRAVGGIDRDLARQSARPGSTGRLERDVGLRCWRRSPAR